MHNQVLLPTEEWPWQFWPPEPLTWVRSSFPGCCSLSSLPQPSVENREPNPGMLLPIPLLDLVPLPANHPRLPGTVWVVESPEQSAGSQKSRIPAQVGPPTAHEHLRLRENARPKAGFPARFLTCKEMVPPLPDFQFTPRFFCL